MPVPDSSSLAMLHCLSQSAADQVSVYVRTSPETTDGSRIRALNTSSVIELLP
ncbi:uncharacterized protein BO97DRAFT_406290 [Aspergillus homomorphus CBS 101889]|uniref:Uncharacterized protein n=1 Tax=Aspergillus homomorphus (strain CBS 101889) TaxID=1450537 RepID=A0A395HWX9_ASPHC|nr:hypothetical protein BO97DRAFT_406290 [Aspergillus homomorphus CBS 101889]RAL11358.1 hypothetical protein BO97DRAFT_406290 [Aspergillus homomorphus CBS 101889]